MRGSELSFTGLIKCGHCSHEVHMREVGYHDNIRSYHIDDQSGSWDWQAGPVWRLLLCPVCSDITLFKYYLDERFEPDEWESEDLFPSKDKSLMDLPPGVDKEYKAALKVRNIDSNHLLLKSFTL